MFQKPRRRGYYMHCGRKFRIKVYISGFRGGLGETQCDTIVRRNRRENEIYAPGRIILYRVPFDLGVNPTSLYDRVTRVQPNALVLYVSWEQKGSVYRVGTRTRKIHISVSIFIHHKLGLLYKRKLWILILQSFNGSKFVKIMSYFKPTTYEG